MELRSKLNAILILFLEEIILKMKYDYHTAIVIRTNYYIIAAFSFMNFKVRVIAFFWASIYTIYTLKLNENIQLMEYFR